MTAFRQLGISSIAGWLATVCLAFTPFQVFALTVFPIRLELASDKKALTVVVTNDKDEDVTVQVIPKLWSQRAKPSDVPENILDDTTDFTVFPAVLQLKPQQKQTVRLRFNGKNGATKEMSYRLLVEELAVNLKPGVLNILQRFSVPVFVKPSKQESTPLQWHIEKKPDGSTTLNVDNSAGARHYQITGLSFSAPNDDPNKVPDKTIPLFLYLLPGISATMPIKETPPPNQTGATLTTDYGTFQSERKSP